MAKVAVTIDERLLREVDRWVAAGEYPNRSRAVQAALSPIFDRRALDADACCESLPS